MNFEIIKSEDEKKCPNCGAELNGKFCSNCGQSDKDFNKSFAKISKDLIAENFSLDTRFFRTIIPLLVKPGKLTQEFFDGKRKRYVPVFQLFFFLSFILFLAISANKQGEKLLKVNDDDPVIDSLQLNLTILNKTDTITVINTNIQNDSLQQDLSEGNKKKEDKSWKSAGNRNKFADELKPKLDSALGSNKLGQMLSSGITKTIKHPDKFEDSFWEVLSQVIFMLLPIFALILRISYWKKHVYFVHHFIFSIHFHSFAFFILILILLIQKYQGLLFLTIPLYLLLSMKKYYKQSWFRTLFKFSFISFVYNISLIFVLLIVLSLTIITL